MWALSPEDTQLGCPGTSYIHVIHGQYTVSGRYPTRTPRDCPRTPLYTYTLYTYTHVYRVRGYMASTLCPEDTQLGRPRTVPGLPYIHTLMYIESEATWPGHYVRRIPNWDVPGLSHDSPTYTHVYTVYTASTLCPEDTQLGRPGTVPGLPYIQ